MARDVQTVLVTGAGSGIGLDLTLRLAQLGHCVYATARRPSDLEALGAIEGVVPVELDLRNQEQVARLSERIERDRGLDGLVNNAGLGGIGPLHTWQEAELLEIFDVNALGPIRMTRAVLPLLLGSRGRVVNIGSQGGSISKRYFGPYTMTKHALEAFTVALADEVEPHGIRVSIVQPGGVATSIGEKSLRGDLERFLRAEPPFAEAAHHVAADLEGASEATVVPTAPESETNRRPSPPSAVTDAVLHALTSDSPRRRYLVGTRWEGQRVLDALLDRLLDANDSPSLGYSENELTQMLRERASRRPRNV